MESTLRRGACSSASAAARNAGDLIYVTCCFSQFPGRHRDPKAQTNEVQGTGYSPTHIRATWNGTGSVQDASRALGFSRAKSYDLVRRGEFPCRVLRIGRTTRVVTASLLRVLESGEPEYNGARAGHCTPS
jgi:predicted DNA-binding transcriptional regulator AlpA